LHTRSVRRIRVAADPIDSKIRHRFRAVVEREGGVGEGGLVGGRQSGERGGMD